MMTRLNAEEHGSDSVVPEFFPKKRLYHGGLGKAEPSVGELFLESIVKLLLVACADPVIARDIDDKALGSGFEVRSDLRGYRPAYHAGQGIGGRVSHGRVICGLFPALASTAPV